ncbi:hypothetical protein Tco_0061306, partial [Tanacetum coccineum]
EGQSSTPIVEKINVLEKQILEGKLVLVDDDGKPLEKVDYPDNSDSDDEVEHVENETASFLASKELDVVRKACGNNGGTVDDEHDPYDNNMYEGQELPKNIQTICDIFYMKVCGRKKKYIISDVQLSQL